MWLFTPEELFGATTYCHDIFVDALTVGKPAIAQYSAEGFIIAFCSPTVWNTDPLLLRLDLLWIQLLLSYYNHY